MKKRMMRLLLLVAVTVVMATCFAFCSSALDATGKCGYDVTWSFNKDTGELVISGTGEMFDYDESDYSPFRSESEIVSVVIENGVTSIGDDAFWDCDKLTSITIPDSITSIGDFAFEYCKKLSDITIPDSVTKIGVRAFCVCESLVDVTIPDSVTSIGWGAFEECTNLKSIIIPDGVTDIFSSTFFACENLESVTIPDSVTSIGTYAFYRCLKLKSIEIPDSVKSIGDFAFAESGIQSITIPAGMEIIDYGTFFACESLECITIPNTVTKIDGQAFHGCYRLKDVYYYGNKPQWNEITIGNYNEDLLNATIHFLCCDHLDTAEFEAVAPTCTNDGYRAGVYCNDCETWLSGHEAIACPGHNPITVKETAATCTEPGYSGDIICSTCGEVLTKGSVLDASGHDFDGSICKVCGFNRSENCSCNCHKGGIYGVFFRLLNFFQKLFGVNKVCACGVSH